MRKSSNRASFIPIAKRSKKLQREFHSKQRQLWMMDPRTRVKPSGKTYSRAKLKSNHERGT